GVPLVAGQVPREAEPAVRVEHAVADDLAVLLRVQPGGGVEPAGPGPLADVVDLGRLEPGQGGTDDVEEPRLRLLVAGAGGADGHRRVLRGPVGAASSSILGYVPRGGRAPAAGGNGRPDGENRDIFHPGARISHKNRH